MQAAPGIAPARERCSTHLGPTPARTRGVGFGERALALQRTAGNRALGRVLAPRNRVLARCEGACTCGGTCRDDELLEEQRLQRTTAGHAPSRASSPTSRVLARCAGPCTCGGACHDDELLEEGQRQLGRAVLARDALPCDANPPSSLDNPRFLLADGPQPTLEACFEDRGRLRLGDPDHEAVTMVQQALVDLHYSVGAKGVDGQFGSDTAAALRKFKEDHDLQPVFYDDVGPKTMRCLNRLAPRPSRPTPPTPPPTPPTPPPKPETKVCGPDVSAELTRAWRTVQPRFAGLSFKQKLDNCRMLVQPLISTADAGDPNCEKVKGLPGCLNANAFDTWGLFQGSSMWTRIPPWHGSCGTPGSTGRSCCNFDRLHEDPSKCSNTVQIGSDCWLMGTPNYGLFGLAMRTCHDFLTPLAFLPAPFSDAQQLFGLANTMLLAGGYKLFKGDNIIGPEKWAVATWLGGPTARATGGNRAGCSPTCPGPAPPPFVVTWSPHMPRTSPPLPSGPPYEPVTDCC